MFEAIELALAPPAFANQPRMRQAAYKAALNYDSYGGQGDRNVNNSGSRQSTLSRVQHIA